MNSYVPKREKTRLTSVPRKKRRLVWSFRLSANFVSVIPSYVDHRAAIVASEEDFLDKIPKLVWRGGLHQGADIRHALLQESEGQSWSDVHGIAWNNQTDVDTNLMTMADHCDYMFTAMTEGKRRPIDQDTMCLTHR